MRQHNIHQAVYTKLSGDAALAALATGGIHADKAQPTDAGDATAFPYVTFGRNVTSPWDSKTTFGGQLSMQIDAWSRSNNYLEGEQIADRIHALLHHTKLDIDDCEHVMTTCESVTVTPDVDGHTKRALMLYRVVVYGLR